MAASSFSFSWSFFRVSFIGLCVARVLVAVGAAVHWYIYINSTFASSFSSAAGFCTNRSLVLVRMSFPKEEQKRNVLPSVHLFARSLTWVCVFSVFRFDGVRARRDHFWVKWATTHITLLNNSTIFWEFPMRQWQNHPQIPSNIRHISNIEYRYVWTCDGSFYLSLSVSFKESRNRVRVIVCVIFGTNWTKFKCVLYYINIKAGFG